MWIKPKIIPRSQKEVTYNIGVCVKTLFNLDDQSILNTLAFIEMQKILAVDQVCSKLSSLEILKN